MVSLLVLDKSLSLRYHHLINMHATSYGGPMDAQTERNEDAKEVQKPVTFGLYPSDVATIQELKSAWKFDSNAQVVRRAIREAAEIVKSQAA